MISSTQTNHPLAGVTPERALPKQADAGDQFISRLKASGLRHTQPRLAIFRALQGFKEPVSIEQIYRNVRCKSCDLVTVYRSLALFEELGLVQRSFSNNGTGLYELKREGSPRFYVTCRNSGLREALSPDMAAELTELLRKIELSLAERGYRNVQHRVEFHGTCGERSNAPAIVVELPSPAKIVRAEPQNSSL